MSVLIKDFEMPKSCIKCQFYSCDTHGCIIASYGCVDRYNFDVSVRQEWCPMTDIKDIKAEPISVRFVPIDNHSVSPCDNCPNHPRNGEVRVCQCVLGAPKITC